MKKYNLPVGVLMMLTLVCCLALLLGGCGSKEPAPAVDGQEQTEPGAAPEEEPQVSSGKVIDLHHADIISDCAPEEENQEYGAALAYPYAFMKSQGPWVYVNNNNELFKMPYDGGPDDIQHIANGTYHYFQVKGDWIYYMEEDERQIWRITTDGSYQEMVVDGMQEGLPGDIKLGISPEFYLKGDHVYYLQLDLEQKDAVDGTFYLYIARTKVDGSETEVVSDKLEFPLAKSTVLFEDDPFSSHFIHFTYRGDAEIETDYRYIYGAALHYYPNYFLSDGKVIGQHRGTIGGEDQGEILPGFLEATGLELEDITVTDYIPLESGVLICIQRTQEIFFYDYATESWITFPNIEENYYYWDVAPCEGGWVCYLGRTNNKDGVYESGTYRCEIVDGQPVYTYIKKDHGPTYIFNDKLYYVYENTLYRCNMDGSEWEDVNWIMERR